MDHASTTPAGPLLGLRVVEFAGIGPGPFACMLLSDMGADVVRVDRPSAAQRDRSDVVGRGRKQVLLDLKQPDAVAQALRLLARADVLIEGFRPGVMERLGLGPDVVAQRNPRLIYGRMTGWGQHGPLAQAAGHDINYIALTGALAAIGEAGGEPVPPLNLVGDYGGGSLYLLVGILAALQEVRRSGRGQVVDAAICDGVLSLMSSHLSRVLRGDSLEQRGRNMLDGGAPYYASYVTADGQYIALGAIEPKFFGLLCEKLALPKHLWDAQQDRARWPQLRAAIAAAVLQRTRDAWCQLLEGSDACFAPVLTLTEAQQHPHVRARGGFVQVDGVTHTAPAPRFSRTPSAIQGPAPGCVTSVDALLDAWRGTSNSAAPCTACDA